MVSCIILPSLFSVSQESWDAFKHHVFCALNLQENQVTSLKSKGIPAEFLSSTQTTHNKNKVISVHNCSGCTDPLIIGVHTVNTELGHHL
jgi:hypothetical protein